MLKSTTSQSVRYSTAPVAASHRFEYWNDVILRHCIPAASDLLSDTGFDGDLEVRGVGTVDLCTLGCSPHAWERSGRHLRTGPDDDLWLGYFEQGGGRLEQGGRRTALSSEDLVIYDAAQTFRFSLEGQRNHLVRIPRHLLSARVPNVDQLTAIVLDNRRPGVVPLREMLRQAAQGGDVLARADVAGRYSRTLLDLLVLSLEFQDLSRGHAERDLHARMMNYIQRHLVEPDLNVDRLAQAHHVSVRTVTRAFARHQQTPMAVIWQQRLRACREVIEQGRARSVSEVALDHGFSDLSHFSHAFRRAFGVTAQVLLRQHRMQPVPCHGLMGRPERG